MRSVAMNHLKGPRKAFRFLAPLVAVLLLTVLVGSGTALGQDAGAYEPPHDRPGPAVDRRDGHIF